MMALNIGDCRSERPLKKTADCDCWIKMKNRATIEFGEERQIAKKLIKNERILVQKNSRESTQANLLG